MCNVSLVTSLPIRSKWRISNSSLPPPPPPPPLRLVGYKVLLVGQRGSNTVTPQ